MSGRGTIDVDGCCCISSLFLGLYLCVFFYLLCFYGVAGWVLIKVFYVGTLDLQIPSADFILSTDCAEASKFGA
jgi:hypothetical protein